MRILVTGGAGFVGSHLVRLLLSRDHNEVINLDALRYSGNLENLTDVANSPRYAFVQGDITDAESMERLFGDYQMDAVINCAAETHVDRSLLDPTSFARTDVVGTGLLLEHARRAGVTRFVQVSTDEVYGSVERGASKEEDALAPRSPYSASKAGADLLVQSYWTSYRFPVLITRGSNTYGPNQYPEKMVPLFVTNALEDQPIPLYGDGLYKRDWLSVFDHCAAIEHVLHYGTPGTVYNVGGDNERENLTVAGLILKTLGKPQSLIRFVEDRPGHDRRYAVDSGRLRALGWKPSITFENGLRATVEWYRDNCSWWQKIKSGEFRTYYERMYSRRLQNGRQHSGVKG